MLSDKCHSYQILKGECNLGGKNSVRDSARQMHFDDEAVGRGEGLGAFAVLTFV